MPDDFIRVNVVGVVLLDPRLCDLLLKRDEFLATVRSLISCDLPPDFDVILFDSDCAAGRTPAAGCPSTRFRHLVLSFSPRNETFLRNAFFAFEIWSGVFVLGRVLGALVREAVLGTLVLELVLGALLRAVVLGSLVLDLVLDTSVLEVLPSALVLKVLVKVGGVEETCCSTGRDDFATQLCMPLLDRRKVASTDFVHQIHDIPCGGLVLDLYT